MKGTNTIGAAILGLAAGCAGEQTLYESKGVLEQVAYNKEGIEKLHADGTISPRTSGNEDEIATLLKYQTRLTELKKNKLVTDSQELTQKVDEALAAAQNYLTEAAQNTKAYLVFVKKSGNKGKVRGIHPTEDRLELTGTLAEHAQTFGFSIEDAMRGYQVEGDAWGDSSDYVDARRSSELQEISVPLELKGQRQTVAQYFKDGKIGKDKKAISAEKWLEMCDAGELIAVHLVYEAFAKKADKPAETPAAPTAQQPTTPTVQQPVAPQLNAEELLKQLNAKLQESLGAIEKTLTEKGEQAAARIEQAAASYQTTSDAVQKALEAAQKAAEKAAEDRAAIEKMIAEEEARRKAAASKPRRDAGDELAPPKQGD